MNWRAFEEAAPELAAMGRTRIEGDRLVLVGTLRRDGSPRISPVEAFFVESELMLGMMWRSRKALDLVRDPRLVVHTGTSDPDGTEGDFKAYGHAVEVQDPGLRTKYADVLEAKINWRPSEPFHLFSVDIETAGYIVFGKEPVAMRWTLAEGLARLPHPGG
jgi:pyridoxamine 5'-phosphate oxidase-like protein